MCPLCLASAGRQSFISTAAYPTEHVVLLMETDSEPSEQPDPSESVRDDYRDLISSHATRVHVAALLQAINETTV